MMGRRWAMRSDELLRAMLGCRGRAWRPSPNESVLQTTGPVGLPRGARLAADASVRCAPRGQLVDSPAELAGVAAGSHRWRQPCPHGTVPVRAGPPWECGWHGRGGIGGLGRALVESGVTALAVIVLVGLSAGLGGHGTTYSLAPHWQWAHVVLREKKRSLEVVMLVLLAIQAALACDCTTFTEPFVVEPGSVGYARLWLRNDSAVNGCTYNMVASQATLTPTPAVTATPSVAVAGPLSPGQTVSTVIAWALDASAAVDVDFPAVNFTFTASTGQVCDIDQEFAAIPSGETTTNGAGWQSIQQWQAAYRFGPKLLPSTANFETSFVRERLSVTADTCYFPGSFVPRCNPTETTWEINSLGQYDAGGSLGDVVGSSQDRVDYYRSLGMTPCECLIQQEMGFAVDPVVNALGWETYKENILSAGIDEPAVDDVTSQRDTNVKTKQCPAYPCP